MWKFGCLFHLLGERWQTATLIHSAELNGANPFDYLVALLQNHAFVEENPEEWMPWNYHETLAGISQ